MSLESDSMPLSPHFTFWTPGEGRVVTIGPDETPVPLPRLPIPVRTASLAGGEPSDDAIGEGLYDYLRQFPDASHGAEYAAILRDAYPHYIADLGAQAVMIDNKEVDPSYLRRKIACLKILALLEPDNVGLMQLLGNACYEVALHFTQLPGCREDLLRAMGYLQRAVRLGAVNAGTFILLGEIDYLLGDIPGALRHWEKAVSHLPEGKDRIALEGRIGHLGEAPLPDHPMVEELELIGEALTAYGGGDAGSALEILERLEEQGGVVTEFPSAEFYLLLGLCRESLGDPGGAFAAFDRALFIDADFAPAREGQERITEKGKG